MNDKELRKLAEAVIDPENDFDPYSTAYEDFTVAANPKAVIELLDRLESADKRNAYMFKCQDQALKDLDKAEATIEGFRKLKSRTFKSLNGIPVGLPENELWVKQSDINDLLKTHDE